MPIEPLKLESQLIMNLKSYYIINTANIKGEFFERLLLKFKHFYIYIYTLYI